MSFQDAFWRDEPNKVGRARAMARIRWTHGDGIGAHSMMLSAHYSEAVMRRLKGHRMRSAWNMLAALPHAMVMYKYHTELSHNELDVLLSYCTRIDSWLPFKLKLQDLAYREVELAERDAAVPHQLALAYLRYAKAVLDINESLVTAKDYARRALALEEQIRAEKDQPQGLRQLARILKQVGEIFVQAGYPDRARIHFGRALALAEGEAQTEAQAEQIKALLASLPPQYEHFP